MALRGYIRRAEFGVWHVVPSRMAMRLTPMQARGQVLELLAVLRDQTGFEAWWFTLDEATQQDLLEELIEVLQNNEQH